MQIEIGCWCKCRIWISIFDVGDSVGYGLVSDMDFTIWCWIWKSKLVFGVSVDMKTIFDVGRCFGYGNRYLVLVLVLVMEIDGWCWRECW